MALTTDERQRLCELAGELARDNPRLARALAGRWYARRVRATNLQQQRGRWWGRWWDWLAVVLIAIAMPLLLAGALLDVPALMVVGAVALVDGSALFTVRQVRRRR